MTWRRIAIAGVVLAVAALAAVLRNPFAGGRMKGASEARPLAAERLRAEGFVAVATDLQETVRAVGTLHANEAVELVAELSRRLAKAHIREGQRVAKGDLLFELDSADLHATLDELVARRQLAANTVDRQRVLLQEEARALSEQDRDRALADLQAIDAQIRGLEVTLAKTQIRAPFAGTIGLRRVSEGAWLTPETVLTTLQDKSRIKLDFALPERYASELVPDQIVRFQLSGRADVYEARLLALEPLIEASTRSLQVRALCENPDDSLYPGAFVSVEVPLHRTGSGVMVPAPALVPSAEGQAVWRLSSGRAERVPVEVGVRTADAVQLLRGIEPGQTVLVTNLLRLQPGIEIDLIESGQAP